MTEDARDRDVFKDYSKPENSDEEERFDALQTQLYGEIYYESGSNYEANNPSMTSQPGDFIDESITESIMLCEESLEHEADSDDPDVYTKYNVQPKKMELDKSLTEEDKGAVEDSSDSEESVVELPLPPKPQPPLIILQDSDKEDENSTEDAVMEKWRKKYASKDTNTRVSRSESPELEIISMHITRDAAPKNKSSIKGGKFLRSTVTSNTRIAQHNKDARDTREYEISENIVLNCNAVQRGATSIDEIRQSSQDTVSKRNQGIASIKDTSKNSTRKSPKDVSKEDGIRSKGRITYVPSFDTLIQYNTLHRHTNQDLMNNMLEVSYTDSNLVVDRKRHHEDDGGTAEDDSFMHKRQCMARQDHQNASTSSQKSYSDGVSGEANSQLHRDEYFKPMSSWLRSFYNDSRGQENFDIRDLQSGMSKDPRLWKILDEDLMPSPSCRRIGRYWLNNIRCSYCQREGHSRKDCPVPFKPPLCHICGEQGHTEKHCSQKVCLTCGRKDNTFRQTCNHCCSLYCVMCKAFGHEERYCPDLWRRYHHTTTETSFVLPDPRNVMKPASKLYCCNCAKRGHEAFACKEFRWSAHFFTPAGVTSYTMGPTYVPTAVSIGTNSKTVDASTSKLERNILPVDTKVDNKILPVISSASELQTLLFLSKNKKKKVIDQVQKINFTNIIYSHGSCRDNNACMIVRDLMYLKDTLLNLVTGKTVPFFINELQISNFEIIIGQMGQSHLILQIIALREYINLLFRLMMYWVNLPDDEKNYAIDVNFPTRSVEMISFLSEKMLLLKNEYTNDPEKLVNEINTTKHSIMNCKDHSQRLYEYLFKLQMELLMTLQKEHHLKCHIRRLQIQLTGLRRVQWMDCTLDPCTYLEILISYNNLFVPHTPKFLQNTIRAFNRRKSAREKRNAKKMKNKQQREESNILPPNIDANSLLPITEQKNIDFVEALITVETQNGDFSNNITIDTKQDVGDVFPEVSDRMENCIQYSQNIVSSKGEPQSVPEPKYPETYELSMDDVNVVSNVQPVNLTMSIINDKYIDGSKILSKAERKRISVALKEERKNCNAVMPQKMTDAQARMLTKAHNVMERAMLLNVPRITKAVEDLREKIKMRKLTNKSIKTLRNMIKVENRKKVNMLQSYLK